MNNLLVASFAMSGECKFGDFKLIKGKVVNANSEAIYSMCI